MFTLTWPYSFFLTPINYFDSDPSMELLNAVVLDPLLTKQSASKNGEKRSAAYIYDDNGVEQHFHCIPEAPAPFEYGVQAGLA